MIEIFLILDCVEAMFDSSNNFKYLDLVKYRMGKKLYYPGASYPFSLFLFSDCSFFIVCLSDLYFFWNKVDFKVS